MIRNRTMPVSAYLYSQLEIVARMENADCAESIAELWLRERLAQMPEIAELVDMRTAARKAADAEWNAKHEKPSAATNGVSERPTSSTR